RRYSCRPGRGRRRCDGGPRSRDLLRAPPAPPGSGSAPSPTPPPRTNTDRPVARARTPALLAGTRMRSCSVGSSLLPLDPVQSITPARARQSPPGLHGQEGLCVTSAAPASLHQVEVFLLRQRPQLLHRPRVQLPHPLLGDAELLADLLQRHALG